jgi:hypothetical protein
MKDLVAKRSACIIFCIQLIPEFFQILSQYLMFVCIALMVGYLYQMQKRTAMFGNFRCASAKSINLINLRSNFNMDIALTDQFYQKYFENGSNGDLATNAEEEIRSLLGIALGAMLAAGQSLKQRKEELGKGFTAWISNNEFVKSDANKLIKLFDCFGENFDGLNGVNPIALLKLLTPNQRASRAVLADLIDESGDSAVSCADVDSIQREHKIKSVPTIKSVNTAEIESNVDLKMVGNQKGGTGIFRLEVKDYQLANQLDNEWKESGFTASQWMRFMSSSARAVQEIAQVVLGRNIVDESELDRLTVAIKESMVEVACGDMKTDFSPVDVGSGINELPLAVTECLTKIKNLEMKIASCKSPVGTDAMMQRIRLLERESLLHKLKMLAVEYELDIETLLWNTTTDVEQSVVTNS